MSTRAGADLFQDEGELAPATASPSEPAFDPRSARPRALGLQPANTLLDLPKGLSPYRSVLRLGTSSWSFPGWEGLVYAQAASESTLSRKGLGAYARHPLLSAAGIDRGFYAPVSALQFSQYADQVPDAFRFLVKAPDAITGASVRDETGRPAGLNPQHLDVRIAIEQFIEPCLSGLGEKAGALVFQFSPLPRAWLKDTAHWIERLDGFLGALPKDPRYAVEIRDPELLTPRLMRTLLERGVGYCLSLHDRMPPIERQLRALDAMHGSTGGPLLVRWNLHQGRRYQAAKTHYAPFNRLVDEDWPTRNALAERCALTLLAGHPVMVIANNKAEGCAPLTLLRLAEQISRHFPGQDTG